MGFFAKSVLLSSKAPSFRIPQCGLCGLHKTCNSPKMPVSGKGRKKILVIAEAPGENEDNQGKQLVGKSGKRLEEEFAVHGIDMRKDCWLTNAIICRPPDNVIPSKNVVDWCRPNLANTLKELQPELIIPLGEIAVKSLLKPLWRNDVGDIGQWISWQIPSQKLNAWICPTYHPSYVLRAADTKNHARNPVVELTFKRDLANAVKLVGGRPWNPVPDYTSQVERILDPDKAAEVIRSMDNKSGLSTFDFETNMLKPDSDKARIVSCSICWNGERTIAYPILGKARKATIEYLQSPIKKMGSNIKFEDRWANSVLKTEVVGWFFDTMIGAHIEDNREDITGLKFQSFVRLGYPAYDEHIKPLLQAKGGSNQENQIVKGIEINQLLLYNGLDSLLEYLVAIKIMKAMNYGCKTDS